MIKRRALTAGLDGAFAGHSLRAGFATEGYAQGTPELAIMRQPLAIGIGDAGPPPALAARNGACARRAPQGSGARNPARARARIGHYGR